MQKVLLPAIASAQRSLRRLGLWIEQTEGAKFWLRVMNELKTRGVEDILIAIVDGLKGFPDDKIKSSGPFYTAEYSIVLGNQPIGNGFAASGLCTRK